MLFALFTLGRLRATDRRAIDKEADVVRRIVVSFVLIACLVIGHRALAQQFSADVASSKRAGTEINKIYSSDNKIRLEAQSKNAAMGPTAVILDESQHKYVALLADRHMYMDAPVTMIKPLITQFWRVDDPNDACSHWKSAAQQAGTDQDWGSCTKVGSDTVNGRDTVKYEGVSKKGDKTYVWVDTKLHCVIKTDDSSGGFELKNIQEGAQPARLFEVPSDYTKFDMGAIMNQRR
jgi:hypothetical protein